MTTSSGNRPVLRATSRTQRLRATARRLREGWAIFSRNRIAMFGLLLILFFGTMPLIYAGLRSTVWELAIYDPTVGFDINAAPHPSPPSWIPKEQLAPDSPHQFDPDRPSFKHVLGTDTLGRDILSVLLASTLPTFIVGMSAALTTAVLGTLIAAYAAYYRGWVDTIFTQVADAFLLLPAPIFMLAVGAGLRVQSTTLTEVIWSALTGGEFSLQTELFFAPFEFGIIYGIIAGAGGAALVLRTQALQIMSQTFIEASRVAGAGARTIIWRHLVPHLMPLALVYMLVAVTGAVVADGFLAFVGFNPTLLNWGTMVYYAITYQVLNFEVPWYALIAPALCISLFAASFYMVSRGLHEAIEPRMRLER